MADNSSEVHTSILTLLAIVLSMMLAPKAAAAAEQSSFCATTNIQKVEARATSPPKGIALILKSDRVQPGAVVAGRLINRSNRRASYGVAYRIERYEMGKWILDPASPDGPWPKKLGRLEPDTAGACLRFTVPSDQSEGKYRFVAFVHADGKKSRRTAGFLVRG